MRFTRSISFLNVGQRGGEERRVESREEGGRDGKRAVEGKLGKEANGENRQAHSLAQFSSSIRCILSPSLPLTRLPYHFILFVRLLLCPSPFGGHPIPSRFRSHCEAQPQLASNHGRKIGGMGKLNSCKVRRPSCPIHQQTADFAVHFYG